MLVGDFNAEESEACLLQHLYEYNTKNIAKKTLALKMDQILAVLIFVQQTVLWFNKMKQQLLINFPIFIFKKHSTIERQYRNYKSFDQTKCKKDLKEKLTAIISNYESFENVFIEVMSNV